MDPTTIRLVAAVIAAAFLGVLVMRRRSHRAE
jgi:hypothetical protein